MKRKLYVLIFIFFITKFINAEGKNDIEQNSPKPPVPGIENDLSASSKNLKSHSSSQPKEEKKKILLTSDELQNILDKFTVSDKKVLKEIQNQIVNWPQNLFEEVRDYREFVISARSKAEKKYAALSPEAKEAINIEKTLKTKLSPGALKLLHDVELQK